MTCRNDCDAEGEHRTVALKSWGFQRNFKIFFVMNIVERTSKNIQQGIFDRERFLIRQEWL